MASLWPTNLRLDINPVGISTVDIQKWIHNNHALVSRIKCPSGPDKPDFIDFVESLRNCGGVSSRQVSANSHSHAAVTVRDCRVGGPRQLPDATSPRAAFHGPALCGVSRERHPEPTDASTT
jgi:hypothetical protein